MPLELVVHSIVPREFIKSMLYSNYTNIINKVKYAKNLTVTRFKTR